MLRAARTFLLATSLVFTTCPLRAESTEFIQQFAEREALARHLLELNHVRDGIECWRDMLREQDLLEACDCDIDDATKQRALENWQAAVEKTFDANAIFSHLTRTVSEQLTTSEMKAAAAFYATDLGNKILQLDVSQKPKTPTPEEVANESLRLRQLLESDPVRQKIAMDLVDSVKLFHELGMVTISIASIGTTIGARAVWPEGQPRPTREKIDQKVAAQHESMKEMIEPVLSQIMAELHQILHTADFRESGVVQGASVHKKVVNAMIIGFREALEEQVNASESAFTNLFTAKNR